MFLLNVAFQSFLHRHGRWGKNVGNGEGSRPGLILCRHSVAKSPFRVEMDPGFAATHFATIPSSETRLLSSLEGSASSVQAAESLGDFRYNSLSSLTL